MRLYGIAFEHQPWSTFGDADKIAPYNPLRRVPTLVLDDGEALIESAMILDYLDDRVGPDKAMIAPRGDDAAAAFADLRAGDRASATRASACCTSACCARTGSSISGSSAARRRYRACWTMLEKERAAVKTPYWFGESIGHADIAVACVLRFVGEAHPALFDDALSGAEGAFRALRGAAAVPGDRAGAGCRRRTNPSRVSLPAAGPAPLRRPRAYTASAPRARRPARPGSAPARHSRWRT